MCLIEEITKLTKDWYTLIGPTHHKNKDCHWYIQTKWSYGLPPKYFVQHNGYILHDFEDQEFETYQEALQGLKKVLEESIEEERKYEGEDDNGW